MQEQIGQREEIENEKEQINQAKNELEEQLSHQLEIIQELKAGEANKFDEFMKIGEYL